MRRAVRAGRVEHDVARMADHISDKSGKIRIVTSRPVPNEETVTRDERFATNGPIMIKQDTVGACIP